MVHIRIFHIPLFFLKWLDQGILSTQYEKCLTHCNYFNQIDSILNRQLVDIQLVVKIRCTGKNPLGETDLLHFSYFCPTVKPFLPSVIRTRGPHRHGCCGPEGRTRPGLLRRLPAGRQLPPIIRQTSIYQDSGEKKVCPCMTHQSAALRLQHRSTSAANLELSDSKNCNIYFLRFFWGGRRRRHAWAGKSVVNCDVTAVTVQE